MRIRIRTQTRSRIQEIKPRIQHCCFLFFFVSAAAALDQDSIPGLKLAAMEGVYHLRDIGTKSICSISVCPSVCPSVCLSVCPVVSLANACDITWSPFTQSHCPLSSFPLVLLLLRFLSFSCCLPICLFSILFGSTSVQNLHQIQAVISNKSLLLYDYNKTC